MLINSIVANSNEYLKSFKYNELVNPHFKKAILYLNKRSGTHIQRIASSNASSGLPSYVKKVREEYTKIKKSSSNLSTEKTPSESEIKNFYYIQYLMIKFFDAIFKSILSDLNSVNYNADDKALINAAYSHNQKDLLKEVEKGEKIFPSENPLPEEIGLQGRFGECAFLAALASIAKSDPEAIKDCFVQLKSNKSKDLDNLDKIKIRFFTIDFGDLTKQIAEEFGEKSIYANPGYQKIYTIDKKTTLTGGVKTKALWPKLLEKAYAMHLKSQISVLGGADIVNMMQKGTSPIIPYVAITGKKAKWIFTKDKKSDMIYSIIKKRIDKNLPVTFGCSSLANETLIIDPKTKTKIYLQGPHGYSVLDACEINGKKCLQLRNPNGYYTNPYNGDSTMMVKFYIEMEDIEKLKGNSSFSFSRAKR